jgi:hypothetical protein
VSLHRGFATCATLPLSFRFTSNSKQPHQRRKNNEQHTYAFGKGNNNKQAKQNKKNLHRENELGSGKKSLLLCLQNLLISLELLMSSRFFFLVSSIHSSPLPFNTCSFFYFTFHHYRLRA